MEKTITQLNKAYAKRFKYVNKEFFTKHDTGLALFAEYLKYLRDFMIVSSGGQFTEKENIKINVATITATITEFDAYKECTNTEQKIFHWNNFWEFIKLNMEEWLKLNDSI